jgi:hypothetical protein
MLLSLASHLLSGCLVQVPQECQEHCSASFAASLSRWKESVDGTLQQQKGGTVIWIRDRAIPGWRSVRVKGS